MTKCCIGCHETKPLDMYHKHKNNEDGHAFYCKECMKVYRKNHYEKTKERQLRLSREWRKNNKEKARQDVRLYEQKNKEKIKEKRDTRRSKDRFQLQHRAHSAIRRGVLSGEIIRPSNCSSCDSDATQIQAHHKDYSNPLDVMWLCQSCHLTIHGNERRIDHELQM